MELPYNSLTLSSKLSPNTSIHRTVKRIISNITKEKIFVANKKTLINNAVFTFGYENVRGNKREAVFMNREAYIMALYALARYPKAMELLVEVQNVK